MAHVIVGTSGFSYKDWVGDVYPPNTAAKDFLSLYAEQFNFTELNFSYYRQPDPRTLARMVHVTPDDFVFAIKAHRSLTHEVSEDFQNNLTLFKQGIAPLVDTAKLAAILIQFPYSFHYTPQSRKHLLRICKAFEHLPAAVEFRNDQWQRESVYRELNNYSIAFVNVDEPDLPRLPRPTSIVSAPFAYIRFHGRNKAQWWKGDNASRYDYLYPDKELMEWIPRIKDIAKQCSKIIVAFNNHWKGQAVTNAKRLMEFLAA